MCACANLVCVFTHSSGSVSTHTFPPSVNTALWYLKVTSQPSCCVFFPPFAPQARPPRVFHHPSSASVGGKGRKRKTLWTLMHPSLIVTYWAVCLNPFPNGKTSSEGWFFSTMDGAALRSTGTENWVLRPSRFAGRFESQGGGNNFICGRFGMKWFFQASPESQEKLCSCINVKYVCEHTRDSLGFESVLLEEGDKKIAWWRIKTGVDMNMNKLT